MILSELLTFLVYLVSMVVLKTYFGKDLFAFTLVQFNLTNALLLLFKTDITFIASWGFIWRVVLVTMVSCLPIYLFRFIKRKLDPPSYTKLS